jgi:aspartokinase
LRTWSNRAASLEATPLRCGENIRDTPGVAVRVFAALQGINVGMISQGASRLNLGLVVSEEDLLRAANALHREFFRDLDPAFFV